MSVLKTSPTPVSAEKRIDMLTSPKAMFCGITASGTAAAETALCTTCNTPENIAAFRAGDVVRRGDCSENDALSCQNCGWEAF